MLMRPTLAAALAFAAAVLFSLPAMAGDDGGRGEGRNVAGDFDYYTLVISWSPTYCATSEARDDAEQCGRRDGRRYAFVLHGLWPQYEEGYPESCPTRRRPYVPDALIDSLADIMPSKQLVIHEYRTHGTCSGLTPQDYFRLSRELFEKLQIPERFKNPFEAQFVAPDDLVDELANLNPGLEPEMIAISCGGPGSRLKDVRICFTGEGAYRACGPNEDQRRLCRALKMHVPPVRSAKTGPIPAGDEERPLTPRRPRLIEGPRAD